MKCKDCKFTEFICYTSNQSTVKCTITNQFRNLNYECDVWKNSNTIKICPNEYEFCVSCLVCGASVKWNEYENTAKICDECKKAIMHIRKQMDGVEE